ncbi:MAG: hypothetical protein RL180_1195 [Pseudomonadota bacterium]
MSKKTSGVLGILVVVWLGSVAVGVGWTHQQAAQLESLYQNQQKLTLQLADLNDRLVATVRQHNEPIVSATPSHFASTQANSTLMYQVVRQGLALAQTALQQDQPAVALSLLIQTEQRLQTHEASVLAPALSSGLIEQIHRDIAQLRQWGEKQQRARQQLDVALSRVQRLLSLTAKQGPALTPTLPTNESVGGDERTPSRWQRLYDVIQIEPAQAGTQASIAIRALTCHQVALLLAQARIALQQQQSDQAVALMREAQQHIHTLPDANARHIDRMLLTLMAMPIPSPLRIESLALLPEQSP